MVETLVDLFNRVLEYGEIPNEWRNSNTILIQKKAKPTTNDLRPIALTNNSYKIFMGIIKTKVENHLWLNENISEYQTGSTKGRRATDNLKMLQYCIDGSYARKEKLYVVAIDFEKAFDSIDRKMMITILKSFNINEKIINIVFKVYNEDKTNIIMNSKI